jgi:hypothetical protein
MELETGRKETSKIKLCFLLISDIVATAANKGELG